MPGIAKLPFVDCDKQRNPLLKILLVHNHYGSAAPSGENQVFEAERVLLTQHGHTVREFTRHSDEIRQQGIYGVLKGAVATPWNPLAVVALRRWVEDYRPDIVHVHNTFPLLSPGIFPGLAGRAARVLTLHNYRLFCPAAIPLRAGRVCTECLDRRSVLPAVRHGCYRGSRIATLPLAASVALHRRLGTWTRQVEAFIALTEFQRDLMIQAGLPAERLYVKPNFFPGAPVVRPWAEREARVVFAGRLSAEKGVVALVRAWLAWGPSAPALRIIGEGELRGEMDRLAATAPEVPIRFLGQLPGAAAQAEIARARLLILPSEWFEGFPMVVREAFAFGTPAAVSAIGPLPSIVRDGLSGVVFPPGDAAALLAAVRAAWSTPGLLERLGAGARTAFATLYTEDANYRQLMAIYEQAIDGRLR